jgi:multicomponent K+:H+ antiporter subunit E
MSHRHETGRSWDRRIIPHPLMTLTLIVLWLALTNDVSPGGVLLGTLLGLVIPIYTA